MKRLLFIALLALAAFAQRPASIGGSGGGGGGASGVTSIATTTPITGGTITTTGTIACPTCLVSTSTTVTHSFSAAFGSTASGATALTAAQTVYSVAPAGFTIATCEITTVPADTATFKVWRIATTGTAVPTVSNSINTSGISIATGSLLRTTSLGDFTSLVIAAEDALAVNLVSVGGTATYASFSCHN